MILILASTFSGSTPNKLPAFPAVRPVPKSATRNTASTIPKVPVPIPNLVKNAVIFLPNFTKILSAPFKNAPNTSSAQPNNLVAILPFLGNFSIAFSPIHLTACLAKSISLVISPFLPAASTASPVASVDRTLFNLVFGIFITLLKVFSPASLVVLLAIDSPASLAAFADAKSITLLVVLVAVFLLNILLYKFLPPLNTFLPVL